MRVLSLLLAIGLSGCAAMNCATGDVACHSDLMARREAIGVAMMGVTVGTSAMTPGAQPREQLHDAWPEQQTAQRTPRGSGYKPHIPERCVEVRDPMFPGELKLACY